MTRSGTNRWQGTISSYYQTEGLTGRDAQGLRAQDFSSKEVTVTLGGLTLKKSMAELDLARGLIEIPGIDDGLAWAAAALPKSGGCEHGDHVWPGC